MPSGEEAAACGSRLLAARAGSFDVSPPIDDFPTQARPPSIFDAIDANDFDLALRVITADPAAVESVDDIPPPLHDCIYGDRPEWLEWHLDHGADIKRREQDYGLRTRSYRRRWSKGTRFGHLFEPKRQPEKQHKLLLFKEKQLAANQCDELLDFKSGRQDGY